MNACLSCATSMILNMRQIESGAKIPSLPVFVTICKELRVSPSYLLADVLEGSGATDLDELTDLLKNATPSQIRMMTAMIKAAIGATEERNRRSRRK